MKITKKELQRAIQRQESRIDGLVGLLAKKGYYDKEPEPQLKQLTQSVFDGLDEKWRFAAVDGRTKRVYVYEQKPYIRNDEEYWRIDNCLQSAVGHHYDTTDWQNSLIERDIAKELTGSNLARAMLERGDKYVMCKCWCSSYADIEQVMDIVSGFAFEVGKKAFAGVSHNWDYAVPINNQGEPLTASEAGF